MREVRLGLKALSRLLKLAVLRPLWWTSGWLLVRAGLVDPHWIGRQAGARFDDVRSAARWYVAAGRKRGASPNRLLEPEWLAPNRWQTAIIDPAVGYALLRSRGKAAHPFLFDSQQQPATAGAPDDYTLLRFGDLEFSYLQWCAVIDEAQLVLRRQLALIQSRTTQIWDLAAEAEYVTDWSHALLPQVSGPLVSVIMPVRNRALVLARAVESVRHQTVAAWELIIVDDGSSDDTAKVAADYAASDSRIQVIRLEPSGVCAARNAGLRAARAPYVAFLDSDNEWTPSFLRVSTATMAAEHLEAAFAVVEERSKSGIRYRTFDGSLPHLQLGNFIDLNALVCRTELVRSVGGFDETLRRMVDYDLAWRVAEVFSPRLLPFVGVRYSADSGGGDRITEVESLAWEDVVMVRRLVDWPKLRSGLSGRDDGTFSVIVPMRLDCAAAVETVRLLLDLDQSAPIGFTLQVVVVDNDSSPGTWRLLWAEVGMDPRVVLVRTARNVHRAAAVALGLAVSTGGAIAVVPAGMEVAGAGLTELWERLTAGADLVVPRAGAELGVFAAKSDVLVNAGGMDPLFVNEFEVADLMLRLGAGDSVNLTDVVAVARRGYEQPTAAQHRDNQREWSRRWPGLPVPVGF